MHRSRYSGSSKSYERSSNYQGSAGGGRGYDSSYQNNGNGDSGGSHRDNISRSMSTDNWRDAKLSMQSPPEDEKERDVLRGGGAKGWGPSSSRNWREPHDNRRTNNDYYDSHRQKYPPSSSEVHGGRRIDYRRSQSSNSALDDDNYHGLFFLVSRSMYKLSLNQTL